MKTALKKVPIGEKQEQGNYEEQGTSLRAYAKDNQRQDAEVKGKHEDPGNEPVRKLPELDRK